MTTRARSLWCDSLTYDVDSLLLAAARFGADHVVLGTDYPFDAREVPAGAVLAGLAGRAGGSALDGIRRANALALMSALSGAPTATTSSGGS